MKHLFLVHSHTLFLTSIGVIEKLRLNEDEVVFVYSRHYKNNLDYPYLGYDYSDVIEEAYHIIFSWSRRHLGVDRKQRDKIVGMLDDFVHNIIKDEYCLYVPHLQSISFQIFATNNKCKDCFFIQEGGRVMYDYITGKDVWWCKLYNKLFLSNEKRFWKAYSWFPDNAAYDKPITAYAFDKDYFGTIPEKIIHVTWPILNQKLHIDTKCPIFVLEGAVELGQIEKSVYVNAVDNLVASCGKKRNYIKFHPIQSQEIQQVYLSMFREKGMEVEVLSMDVPFELLISSFRKLTICGFGSSLLFYAKALGHIVISHESELLRSKRYKYYCRNISKL